MGTLDIDGSERISNEEMYFLKFADKNGDRALDENEFYQTLYKTDCKPHCPISNCRCRECPASGVVKADCPSTARRAAPSVLEDGEDKKANFALHDLDQDGKVGHPQVSLDPAPASLRADTRNLRGPPPPRSAAAGRTAPR
jgi:hypothetical protein